MGANYSVQKVTFEDIQYALQNKGYVLINTLPPDRQDCLIKDTLPAANEADELNRCLKENLSTRMIVYGENATDESVMTKCHQLRQLGFLHVYAYAGGLFEWLLLQDIYGADLFPTTSFDIEHLKYKGLQRFGVLRLVN